MLAVAYYTLIAVLEYNRQRTSDVSMISCSKMPIRNLSYTTLTDFKYDWLMIGPSNKDCLVSSLRPRLGYRVIGLLNRQLAS